MANQPPRLTVAVPLSGQQRRVKELILYIAKRCIGARYFGAIKLNKIIWKADFSSFAAHRVPITGREYRRRVFGPALFEMLPIHREMLAGGFIETQRRIYTDGITEVRTIPLVEPELSFFTEEDLSFVESAIQYYWDKTGTEASDDSHGVAWSTRSDGDVMPYELAFLSDDPLDLPHLMHIEKLIYERGWTSR